MSDRQRERERLRSLKWGKKSPSKPIKVCSVYVPLPTAEVYHFNEDALQISQSLKHFRRQIARLKKMVHTADTDDGSDSFAPECIEPAAFRKLAKTVLSSKRCLQAAMWKANARRSYSSRVSGHAILAGSHEYKVLGNLDEQVVIHKVPKSDGTGLRKLCDFGPVARGAQDMAASILRLTYSTRPFQFDNLGSGSKVEYAMDLIEKGYVWFAEVDIIKFFPNFERSALEDALHTLPKAAVAQIVVAASAILVSPKGSAFLPLSPQARPGIPLGSSASVEVAKWSVACMPAFELGDVVLINHVDNFYLFARDVKSLAAATKTLRSAIRGCPGGHFLGKTKQTSDIASEFEMLGCHLSVTNGIVVAEPTDTNLKRLRFKFQRQSRKATKALLEAATTCEKCDRFVGVVEYVTLEALANAWTSAFSVCAGGYCWNVVTDDLQDAVNCLKNAYEIQPDEIENTRRFVGTIDIDGYWF